MKKQDNRCAYGFNYSAVSSPWSGPDLDLKPIAKAAQCGAIGVGIGLINSVANAAIVTVNNDGDAGMGCTLRKAVLTFSSNTVQDGCVATGSMGADDTIAFAPSLSGQNITLTDGQLNISGGESISIEANITNNVTVTASTNSRIFSVDSDSTFSIAGLTLTGGSAANGGAIYLQSPHNFSASYCEIRNNRADNFGGGINARGQGTMTIENCTITANTAGQDGGGIYASLLSTLETSSTITLTSSMVSNNTATGDEGGGIWSYGTRDIVIYDTQVTGNTSANEGGGIFAGNGVGTAKYFLALGNSTISSNVSGYGGSNGSGGGIYFGYRNPPALYSINSDISNNQARGTSANGGGIAIGNSTVDGDVRFNFLLETSVSGNSATGDGGGVFVTNNSTGDSFNVVSAKYGARINGNTADGSGGGIFLGNKSALLLSDGTVNNNTASLNGGGVAVDDYGVIVAGVYDSRSETLTGSAISGNSAVYRGGGIYIANQTVLAGGDGAPPSTIQAVTLNGNRSGREGGGVFLGTNVAFNSKYNTFSSNRSGTAGAGLSNAEGGGMLVESGSVVSLLNSTFSGNQSPNSWGGGAVYNGGDMTIANSTFSGNSSNAVYQFNGIMTITNSILANSTAGTPDCQYLQGTINIDDVSIVETDADCGATRSGDPKLGPLTNNGGPTQTHLPMQTSIAVNTGSNMSCLELDQRGNPRALANSDRCDVGAVEFVNGDIKGFFVIPLPDGKVVVVPE